jgi:hypothetical protein
MKRFPRYISSIYCGFPQIGIVRGVMAVKFDCALQRKCELTTRIIALKSQNGTGLQVFRRWYNLLHPRLILIQSYFPRLASVLHEAEAFTAAQQE